MVGFALLHVGHLWGCGAGFITDLLRFASTAGRNNEAQTYTCGRDINRVSVLAVALG